MSEPTHEDRLSLSDDEARVLASGDRVERAEGLRDGDEHILVALQDRNLIDDWAVTYSVERRVPILQRCRLTVDGRIALQQHISGKRLWDDAKRLRDALRDALSNSGPPVDHYFDRIRTPRTAVEWSGLIEEHKSSALTTRDIVLAVALHLGIRVASDSTIDSPEALAKAMFVAANTEEILRRSELDDEDVKNAGPICMSVRGREVIAIMWDDPTYSRERERCEKAAERVWHANRIKAEETPW